MSSVLGDEWHISSLGNDFLTENSTSKEKQQIYNLALNTDLKEISKPVLHEITNNEIPKLVLQIHKVRNISAPKANEESQHAPRLLKLTLTDGETYIQGLEITHIGEISLKNTPPGTKLLITKVKIANGYLLLSPQNCKVLGGKVPSLIEKWEVPKNVQRNRRNDNEDGPPPWVNFGTKIKAGNQEGNFKSLTDKAKELKEASEFDQQRKDAIAEAASGAVRKVFSGRVKQSVDVQSANNKKKPPRENKKEMGRPRGKTLTKDKDVDEKPLKPSDKVSLFAFLEDKLPVTSAQEGFYQSQPSKNVFKEVKSFEDNNKYDRRKPIPIPKQFEKPQYNKPQGNTKNEYSKRENSYASLNENSFNKQSNYRNPNSNFNSNDQYKQKPSTQPTPSYTQNNHSYPQQNRTQPQQNSPYPQQNNTFSHQQNNYHPQNSYPQNNYYAPQNSYQIQNKNQNFDNFPKQPYQRQNVQNDVGRITQEVQNISLNSQFASRTLRQHLNLNGSKRNEVGPGKSIEPLPGRMNIGDVIMAKYWEDGKFYSATIISITDKTFAVKFMGYGNIEEILKSDCQPASHNDTRANFNQPPDRGNRPFSGPGEFRRRNWKQ